MFNFFKKKEKEEEKENFTKGLVYGLGGALVILIVILLIIFGGSIKDKVFSGDDGDQDQEVGSEAPKLRFTIITSKSCGEDCFDINLLIDAIKQNSIKELGSETIYIEDRDGKKLVDKYDITKVPTLLIGGEINKDPNLANAWPVLGEVMDDIFIYREIIPPYIEVSSGELKGLVNNICQ